MFFVLADSVAASVPRTNHSMLSLQRKLSAAPRKDPCNHRAVSLTELMSQVQFIHRLRTKTLKGKSASISTTYPRQHFAFHVPKGWKILPGPPAGRTHKNRRIAHRFSGESQ